MSVAELSPTYQRAVRTLLRYAIVMAIIGLLIGISYRESTKKLPYEEAPAGVRLESVMNLALVHGHVFLMGMLMPIGLAAALVLARRAGGAEVSGRSLRWLTRGYLPFAAASVLLQLSKGYHVLLMARAGERDFAVIDGAFMGGSHVLRYLVYAVVHAGMGVTLGVFLVQLWRSLGKKRLTGGGRGQAAAAVVMAAAMVAVPAGPAPADQADPVTALVIIDIQEFYFPGGAAPLHEPGPAAANAGQVLARFRAEGRPVVHVQHAAKQGQDSHAHVAPREGEPVIVKREVNAFHRTDLLATLRDLGADHLVLVGMQTHMCLEAATRAAADLGFACTVIADACATRDLVWEDRTVPAADVHAATLATLRAYAEVMSADAYLAR
ncbi:isochorismatase family protein [bacterium]|nr:isochorismatase family protein [bacterium]